MNDLIRLESQNESLQFVVDAYIPGSDRPEFNEDASSDLKALHTSIVDLDHDDVLDVQFTESVSSADHWDYLVAAASGTLTAALDILWVEGFSLVNAQAWGHEKTNHFVTKVAQSLGYKGDDLAAAIRYLEKKFPLASDQVTDKFGSGLQHHLRDFGHHPTILGLVFSLLTQFTGMTFGTNTEGLFAMYPLPDQTVLGKNTAEKIFNGVIVWAFHLISDMAGSSMTPGKGTGIPGPLLALMKEISVLPFFKDLAMQYKEDSIGFSVWISKLFNGTFFARNGKDTRVRFDLRTEIGVVKDLSKQTLPVLLNECIVRGFYLIRRFVLELQSRHVMSLKDLKKIHYQNILPRNNRIIRRMLTVSSGVFVTIVASGAAVKAAAKNKGVHGQFVQDFLLGVNYIGVGRFVVAVVKDTRYLVEDAQNLCEAFMERYRHKAPANLVGLESLCLTEAQAHILQTLKCQKISFDIQSTKQAKTALQKKQWHEAWMNSLFSDPSSCESIDFSKLQNCVAEEATRCDDTAWLYLLALELLLFAPYHPLNDGHDKEYGSLKVSSHYETEVFCKLQSVISLKDIDELSKSYKHYISLLTNRIPKTLTAIAFAAAATFATSGLAGVFAPKIAVLLAGKSFAGLYGAALTKASLAMIGGGSIAAGGLGVVGGTAIITGGGALLGLASSSAVTVSSMALWSSKNYTLNECGKLLAFCKTVLIYKFGRKDLVASICEMVAQCIHDLQEELDSIKKGIQFAEKNNVSECKASLKYLQKCHEEIRKLL